MDRCVENEYGLLNGYETGNHMSSVPERTRSRDATEKEETGTIDAIKTELFRVSKKTLKTGLLTNISKNVGQVYSATACNGENAKTVTRLLPLLGNTKRILVIGPILLDEYAYGACHRNARESGAPVFSDMESIDYFLGGAANVANNAAALGMNVDMLAVIGEQDNAVLELLETKGIGTGGILVCPKYAVSRKRRFVANGHHLMRWDRNNEYLLTEEENDCLFGVFQCMMRKNAYDAVTLSDYLNELSDTFVQKILAMTNRCGTPTIVDPARAESHNKFFGCTYIKPNLDEAQKFCKREITSNENIKSACEELTKNLNAHGCFLTLAERGIAVYCEDNKGNKMYNLINNPKMAGSPVDVCGAGDTALAAIAFGIVNRLHLTAIGYFATVCATDVIGKIGTAVVDIVKVIPEKVLYSKQELKILRKFVPKDKIVVLTGVNFDKIPGKQEEALRQAKELGDILIIALNLNESAKRNKVDPQFVVDLAKRTDMLLATKNVDFVVVSGECESTWIAETLDPDICL